MALSVKSLWLVSSLAALPLLLGGCYGSNASQNRYSFMAPSQKASHVPGPMGPERAVCTAGEAIRDGYKITVEGKFGKTSISPVHTAADWAANNIQICIEWNSFHNPPTRSSCTKFAQFNEVMAFGSEAYFFHDVCLEDRKTGDTWVSMVSSTSFSFVQSGSKCVARVSGGSGVADMFSDPGYGVDNFLISCAIIGKSQTPSEMEQSAEPAIDCVKYGVC